MQEEQGRKSGHFDSATDSSQQGGQTGKALLERKHRFSSPELCCRRGIKEFLEPHRSETMAWPTVTLFIGMSSIAGDWPGITEEYNYYTRESDLRERQR